MEEKLEEYVNFFEKYYEEFNKKFNKKVKNKFIEYNLTLRLPRKKILLTGTVLSSLAFVLNLLFIQDFFIFLILFLLILTLSHRIIYLQKLSHDYYYILLKSLT